MRAHNVHHSGLGEVVVDVLRARGEFRPPPAETPDVVDVMRSEN
jgi:hypothetical protein